MWSLLYSAFYNKLLYDLIFANSLSTINAQKYNIFSKKTDNSDF